MKARLGYIEKEINGTLLWVREDYDQAGLLERLDFERLQSDSDAQKLPTGRGTSVFRLRTEGKDLFVKFFHPVHWRYRMKAPFLKTKAKWAWENAQLLLREGFQTPPVVIAGERRVFRFVQKAFFVTEAVDAVSLKTILKGSLDAWLSERGMTRKFFFLQLGRLIGSLHAKGIYHGDLHSGNLWISDSSRGEDFGLYFLDNEGARHFRSSLPKSRRLHDLRDLNDLRLVSITAKDRGYFFRGYLEENSHLRPVRKPFIDALRRLSVLRHGKSEFPAQGVAF